MSTKKNQKIPQQPNELDEPNWGPIGKEVYERTYSRVKADGKQETWFDTIKRVVEGNLNFVDSKYIESNEAKELFELFYHMKALPAGRHLWVTGIPGREFISNCWNSHWWAKFSKHFTFLFERLMEGGGVGANYSNKYLRKYPALKHPIDVHFVCSPDHKDYDDMTNASLLSKKYSPDWPGSIQIPDSREGWVMALELLMNAVYEGSEPLNGTVPENTLVFDVSHIRPRGAKIKSFGGTASGPIALMDMLCSISSKLNDHVGEKPSSMLCMEIDHEIGRCVVAGNVRRCLPGSTLVTTRDGLVPIKDIQVGASVLVGKDKYSQVKHLFKQGIQETININTQLGDFECTPNHKVAVLTSVDGDYAWKEAQHLKSGDRLVFIPQSSVGSTTYWPGWNYEKPEHSTTCKDIDMPSQVNTDNAYFLGNFLGDGYTYPNFEDNGFNAYISVACSPDYPAIQDKIRAAIKKFGVNISEVGPKATDKSIKICAQSKQLAWYMSKFKTTNQAIRVPKFILKAHFAPKAAFLAGLFDADGSVKTRPVQLVSTVYKEFAQQVQALYASLGIPTRLTKSREAHGNWQELWSLNLVGTRAFKQFNASVAHYSVKQLPEHTRNRLGYGFPNQMIRNSKKDKTWKGKWDGTGQMNHDVYESIYGATNFIPIEVYGVTPGRECNTFDIEVEGDHCFVAHGLLVHNSARMSMKHWKDKDILDFLKCKDDGTSHWTTNISVVIDNSFFRHLKKKDKHARKIARYWAKGQLNNGEPGFYNISKASEGEPTEAFTTNPCLSGNNWVMTNEGPRQIKEIVDRGDLSLLHQGVQVPITNRGFFKTGEKSIYELKTKSGHIVELTKDHQVLTTEGKRPVSDLKPGDRIILSNQGHMAVHWPGEGTFEQGWLLGLLVGDGCISGNRAYIDVWGEDRDIADRAADILKTTTETRSHFGVQQANQYDKSRVSSKSLFELTKQFSLDKTKQLGPMIEKASSAFYKGFLRGFFDADGSVQGTAKKGYSIRLAQSDLNRLQVVQRMLSRMGIFSRIYENRRDGEYRLLPDGKGGEKEYFCQDQHELVISSSQMYMFYVHIGFGSANKQERLKQILENHKQYSQKFISDYEYLYDTGRTEPVYDVQVPNHNVLDCNGIIVSNCGEIAFSMPAENCNLGHVNMAAFTDNQSGFLKACRLITRFLIRATFADFPDPLAQEAIEINRRIGVGLFGFQSWLAMQGIRFSESHENPSVRKFLRKAREVIRKEARDYAFQLRIPEPIKVTTVAPTGTIAKLAGETEGIHTVFGRYFIRRVRYSVNSPEQLARIKELEKLGYPIEDDVVNPNTKVVSFYVKDPLVERVVNLGYSEDIVEQAGEVDLDDMLAVQTMVQEEFTDNAISFTINIKPNQYKIGDLVRGLRTWGSRLKGSTIMPMISNRPQMPYEQITKEQYEAAQFHDVGQGEIECKGNVCPVK